MKLFFFAFFLLPLFTVAQDCTIKKEVDQFTQEPKITTGFARFRTNNITLSVEATKKEIDFFFSFILNTSGVKCFDDASTVTINFEDDRVKSNFRNSGSMNCEGLFNFTIRNSSTTPTQLQRLATKKVASLHFTGNNKAITEVTLSEEEKQLFMQIAACIMTEAKKLVQ